MSHLRPYTRARSSSLPCVCTTSMRNGCLLAAVGARRAASSTAASLSSSTGSGLYPRTLYRFSMASNTSTSVSSGRLRTVTASVSG